MPKKIANFLKKIWGYFPLSAKGLLIASALGGLWCYEVLKQNDFILLVVCVGFGIVLILALLQLILGVVLFFVGSPGRARDAVKGRVGDAFLSGFKIRRIFLTPSLEYHLSWLAPWGVDVSLVMKWNGAHEQIRASRRVEAAEILRRLEIRDVLGLVKFRHVWTTPQPVAIESRRVPVSAMTMLELMAAGDEIPHPEGEAVGDLLEVRQYQRGVPLNRILWKVYGRNRKLMVRMPETALARQKKNHVYFVTGPRDEPVAELLLSLLSAGVWGRDFVFATDGVFAPTQDPREAARQILASSAAPQPANNLEAFLRHSAQFFQSQCVVLAAAEEGAWLEKVENLAGISAQNLNVLMVSPTLASRRPLGEIQKIFLNPRENENPSYDEIRETGLRLRKRGISLRVFDLKTGRVGSV